MIKPKNTYEKYDFQENVITQIVDSDSLELYKDSTVSDEQKYEQPIYESFLQQQINTEEKEAIRLFRNPKFVFAVLVNNKHQIMIQIQKEYLNGNISSGLIESLLVTNPFKLSQEEIYIGIIATLRNEGYSKSELEYGIKRIPDNMVIDFDKDEDILKLLQTIRLNIKHLHTLN